jgi:hypothetical protein
MTAHGLTSPDPPGRGHPLGCGSCQEVVDRTVKEQMSGINISWLKNQHLMGLKPISGLLLLENIISSNDIFILGLFTDTLSNAWVMQQ